MDPSGNRCIEPNSASKGLTLSVPPSCVSLDPCVWTSLMWRSKSLCSSTGLEGMHPGGRDAGTKHRPLLHSQHNPYLAVRTKDTHTHTHTQRGVKLWISPLRFPGGEDFQTALLGDILQTFSQQELNPAGICSEV